MLNFKLKNYDIVEKKLINKFNNPSDWRNYILNFKKQNRNVLSKVNSEYNLRVIDQYGSNHFFPQKISSEQTIKNFLKERGFYIEQCGNASNTYQTHMASCTFLGTARDYEGGTRTILKSENWYIL